MNFILRIKLLLAFVIILMSCSEKSTDNPETDEEIAAGLWQKITTENYNNINGDWSHWPGTTGKYPPDTSLAGNVPHGYPEVFQTYVNSIGMTNLSSRSFPMADKAIVVKENYQISETDTTLLFLTVMLKKNGYDSENNDWFWVKYNPDGSIAVSGKVSGCISCHGGANSFHSDTDYLWTRLP